MVYPARPVLPDHVQFEWLSNPIVEDNGKGSLVKADVRIEGKFYRVTHHFSNKKVTQEEAIAKLRELTDKIILIKTRYFYEDVSSVRFNEKDHQVQRTYLKPEQHNKKVSFTNQFNDRFDKQLQDAHKKLIHYAPNSEKHNQTLQRIERIKATKVLYDFLKTNHRLPLQGQDQFTIEKKNKTLPLAPPRADDPDSYQEQQVQLELAHGMFAKFDEQIKALEAENERLKGQKETKQRVRELEVLVQHQKALLLESEQAQADLQVQLEGQKGLFQQTEAALIKLQTEMVPRTAAQIDGLKSDHAIALNRFREEVHQLGERQDQRLAQGLDAQAHAGHLMKREASAAAVPQLPVLNVDIQAEPDQFDTDLVQRELQLLAELRKTLQEREAIIQTLQAEVAELRLALFKEASSGIIPEVG